MMSVFSEQAPRDLKVFYAFKIYGMDHQVNQTDGWTNRRTDGRTDERTVREPVEVDLAVPIVPWDEKYIRRSDTTSMMHENICTEQPIDFADVQRVIIIPSFERDVFLSP